MANLAQPVALRAKVLQVQVLSGSPFWDVCVHIHTIRRMRSVLYVPDMAPWRNIADAVDSESAVERRVGANPTEATIPIVQNRVTSLYEIQTLLVYSWDFYGPVTLLRN